MICRSTDAMDAIPCGNAKNRLRAERRWRGIADLAASPFRKPVRLFVFAAPLLFAGFAPSTAFAQIGSFGAAPIGNLAGAELSLNLGSVYDTNSAQASASLARREGLVQGEAIVLPSASVAYSHAFGADSLYIQGSGGYNIHLRNHQLSREHVGIVTGGNFRVGSCGAAPTAAYSTQETQPQDLVQSHNIRNASSVQSYQLTLSCQRQIGLSPTISASYSKDSNQTGFVPSFDSYLLDAGLAYDQPVAGRLVAFGQYQDVLYQHFTYLNGIQLSGVGYSLVSSGLRLNHSVGGRFNLLASVAYSTVSSSLPGGVGFNGPTYSGELDYTLSSRIALDASFQRSIQPSNYPGVSFVKDSQDSVSISYALPPRGQIALSASTEQRQYEQSAVIAPVYIAAERRNFLALSSSWKLIKGLLLTLSTRYERRIADPGIYTWSGVRTGLTLSAVF